MKRSKCKGADSAALAHCTLTLSNIFTDAPKDHPKHWNYTKRTKTVARLSTQTSSPQSSVLFQLPVHF